MTDSGRTRDVPRGLAVAIVVVAILAFGALGIQRYSRLREESVPAPAPRRAEPVHVPKWLPDDQVQHGRRFSWTWEDPRALQRFRTEEGLEQVVAGASSDEERARRLMSWTRAQFEPGTPSPYPPPDARRTLQEIRAGVTGGFCAQHAFVLVQAAQALGLPARNVTIAGHEVTEIWLRDEKRWTTCDPFFETQAFDPQGRSLSALEIHEAGRAETPLRLSDTSRLTEDAGVYADRFDRFAVWLHAAFASRPINFTDFERYKLYYEPLPRNVEHPPIPPAALSTPFAEDIAASPVGLPSPP